MKKLKITETQRKMLESTTNAKMKLTESIPLSQSPSAKVTGEFKKGKISGFKAEGAETPIGTEINMNELTSNVLEFLKQIYTNPTKEGLNPYWETIGIGWDELIQMLTAVGIIKSVSGGYRVTKVVENPAKVVKIVSKLVEKMVKDKTEVPVEEIERKDVVNSFKGQLNTEPKKTGKSRAELLAIIAAKRAESQKMTADRDAKRDVDNNASVVDEGDWFDNHPDHPANQVDNTKQGIKPKTSPLKLLWFYQDIAIFENGGKFYAYNVETADEREYADYADREQSYDGRDEDGMADIDYGDWDMSGEIVDAYVNDNLRHLSTGKGIDDWGDGVELVEIDREMAQDFMGLAKSTHIKPDVGASLAKVLSSMNLAETTSTGSVGGSFVGKMGDAPIAKSNVASELKNNIDEEDSNSSIKSDIISSISPFITQTPDFWLGNESTLKDIVSKIQTLDDDEWTLMIQFIVKALQSAETFMDNKNEDIAMKFSHAIGGLTNFIKHFSQHIGEATTTTSVGGDSGTFAYDAPAGDGGNFWTAGNKMNKKSVKENAKTDTQYPKGEFVKFDDCTKPNNNKVAQKGGCSTGAVDNVVKTTSSKDSVISDSSIYESVAKATGRTIEEVKAILDNKKSKSN